MPAADKFSRLYQDLANCYDRQGQPQVRDRLLLLAAEAALNAGNSDDAERLRSKLLQLNPHHLIKPFPSLSSALQAPDVKSYVEGLRRTYPRDNVEQLLSMARGSMGGVAEPIPGNGDRTVPSAFLNQTEMKRVAQATRTDEARADETALSAKTEIVPFRQEPMRPISTRLASTEESSDATFRLADERPAALRPTATRSSSARQEATAVPTNHSIVDETERHGGAWLVIGLYWLVFWFGLTLAVYTLARPFLWER